MQKPVTHAPLFVELSEEHQREDAYSGPHGFVFGGEFIPTKLEMAEQYLHAANILADTIKRQEQEDFRLANPVLFLYRHALELVLKALLRTNSTHHRLDALAADLKTFARQKYQQEVPSWITSRLAEIAALDPNSMAFRYGEEKYGGSKEFSPVPGETYVSVGYLQKSVNELFSALADAAGRIGPAPEVVTPPPGLSKPAPSAIFVIRE
ncbi:HEPN domain-containing protein [Paucibacter sp. DJ2R-2]|uniref:HEPN domain-containing protein n=1 Tax=Paucibacter sp. DJ2R-2 TaxID=2893558 RepID=UPI0021E36685|nr:HEPN domain-containing protein [Paucibacter sp. DJ2R-2]MCV2438177.1 HEPN domain-containing protein [Paucibacter sp. DJ2R-2]